MPVMEGKAVLFKAVRRRGRRTDLPRHHRRRGDHRDGRPAGAVASAASTSRTSRRRAASRSRTGSRSGSTSRSSTTTSTAPPWWRWPRCTNALRLTGRNPESTRVVISGRRRGRCRGRQDPARGRHQGPRGHRPQGRPALLARRPHPGEAGAGRDDRRPDRSQRHPGRRARRRRRLHRRLRRHRARGGRRPDGAGVDHLRAGQPEPRGAPRRRAQVRAGRGHRPLRLPQPDQQRARLPRASSGVPSTSTRPRSPRG